jgi:hypothetical protein
MPLTDSVRFLDLGRALGEVSRVPAGRGRTYVADITADGVLGRLIDNRQRRMEPAHVKFYSTKVNVCWPAARCCRSCVLRRVSPSAERTVVLRLQA